jgi:O-acetyl-ADP-ribose deacetylase (regulator of RNase III)
MKYEEIEGNLITLALEGKFNVIAHGCNCFCKMKRGLAPQMDAAFGCAWYPMERPQQIGDINKLGQIDCKQLSYPKGLVVVNAYTQYHWDTETKPLDYEALVLCLRKINHVFRGKHIGLPQIGCHLAGGDWATVKRIIQKELVNMDVTVVIYNGQG